MPNKKTSPKKSAARNNGTILPPISKVGLLRQPSEKLFKALLAEGKKELKAELYETAEDTFFHARMIGVMIGKGPAELRAARVGQLEAFARLLAASP